MYPLRECIKHVNNVSNLKIYVTNQGSTLLNFALSNNHLQFQV